MTNKNIQTILELCSDYYIELVSFGLAPNPNGFCFEYQDFEDPTTEELEEQKQAGVKLSKLLNALTTREEEELKRLVF